MIRWIVIFLVIALIAAALGFGGIAGASAEIAKIIFYIFIVLLVISLIMNFVRRSWVDLNMQWQATIGYGKCGSYSRIML